MVNAICLPSEVRKHPYKKNDPAEPAQQMNSGK